MKGNEKLLVYFSGFNQFRSDNAELVAKLSRMINATPIIYTGRYPFGGRHDDSRPRHYDILDNPLRHIPGDKYDMAMRSYEERMGKAIREYRVDFKDIILMGRDQGAFMAMQLAYSSFMGFGGVISIDGYYLDDPMFGRVKNTDTPMIWFNTQISHSLTGPEQKTPYALINAGVNVLTADLREVKNINDSNQNLRHFLWAMRQQKML